MIIAESSRTSTWVELLKIDNTIHSDEGKRALWIQHGFPWYFHGFSINEID